MKVSANLFILVALTVVMFGFEGARSQTGNLGLEARFSNINGQLRTINSDIERIDSALEMRLDYPESEAIWKMQARVKTLEERIDLLSNLKTQRPDSSELDNAKDIDDLRQEVRKNNSSTNNVEVSDFQKLVALRDDIDSLKEEIAKVKRSIPAPARTGPAPAVRRP